MKRPAQWSLPPGSALDALLVAALTFASSMPSLTKLGFYGDDWALLANFSAGGADSLLAWDRTVFPGRPLQGFYLTALYRAFGLDPLGYHLVNAVVLSAAAALFFTLLVRLGSGRAMSFATAILFVMLPQLSTVRVWYAAFQAPLSLALALASMHCLLSFSRSRRLVWFGAALVGAASSFAAYEIFAPLIAGFAAGLMFQHWRAAQRTQRWKGAAQVAVVLAVTAAAFAAKLAFSGGRIAQLPDASIYRRGLSQLFRVDYDWRVDAGMNVFEAPRMNFWEPVKGLWAGAGALLTGGTTLVVAVIAVAIGAAVLWRLVSSEATPAKAPVRLLAQGIAAFALGNVVFLAIPAVFTPTGVANRLHVAAAVGVAMILVALLSLATTALPPRRRQIAFSAIMAAVTAFSFVRMSAIERYWAEAPELQARLLEAARSDLRNLPSGSVVILDGVCPFHGPAIVFETSWDVTGALTIALERPVQGDIVDSRTRLTPRALQTSIYGDVIDYPFGDRLFIYNPSSHRLLTVSDFGTAERYFAARGQIRCPGSTGRGSEI